MSELESAGKLTATRDGWHRVAEHVLAAAQYGDTGKIGLRPSTAGFATARPLHGGRQLRVAEADLIVTDGAGSRSAPLTTVGAAARFAGVTPGMPERVYHAATPFDVDDPFAIDPATASGLMALVSRAAPVAMRCRSRAGVCSRIRSWFPCIALACGLTRAECPS